MPGLISSIAGGVSKEEQERAMSKPKLTEEMVRKIEYALEERKGRERREDEEKDVSGERRTGKERRKPKKR